MWPKVRVCNHKPDMDYLLPYQLRIESYVTVQLGLILPWAYFLPFRLAPKAKPLLTLTIRKNQQEQGKLRIGRGSSKKNSV